MTVSVRLGPTAKLFGWPSAFVSPDGDRTRDRVLAAEDGVAGNDVHLAVAEEVAHGARQVIAADLFKRIADEPARFRLLQEDHGIELERDPVGKNLARQVSDRDDVQQPVAVEVGGHGPHRAVHVRQVMVLEL